MIGEIEESEKDELSNKDSVDEYAGDSEVCFARGGGDGVFAALSDCGFSQLRPPPSPAQQSFRDTSL